MIPEGTQNEPVRSASPWVWLGMWALSAASFLLLLNAIFALHLASVPGWGRPGTPHFSQRMFTVLAMASLMMSVILRGRTAPHALIPQRLTGPALTVWDLAERTTACLMGLILVGVVTSRQQMSPNWWALALSLAGFYGVTALTFWWVEVKLSPSLPVGPPMAVSRRDPFLSCPSQGVLVFRRPQWTFIVCGLMVLMFGAPAVYLANALMHGMPGTRLSPVGAVGSLLFYGGLTLLFLMLGKDSEVRFDLRDRTYRQTPVVWGIHRRGRAGRLDEIAGLRLAQKYSASNPIWIQVVWRDRSRPTEELTQFREETVACENLRSLAETLDLAILPPVFEPLGRTSR